ncbi:MAG: hypothetical protein IT454_20075 [Planctomycetes bacterium]|nr:hypothetical protein [Planctomycetota bacterium]
MAEQDALADRLVQNLSTRVTAVLQEVDQLARSAAERSKHIEDGRLYVDKVRLEAETALSAVRAAGQAVQVDAQSMSTSVNRVSAMLETAEKLNLQAIAHANDGQAALKQLKSDEAVAAEVATESEALLAKIKETAESAAQHSAHIEDGRGHAQSVRESIDELHAKSTKSASEAQAESDRAQQISDAMRDLLAELSATKSSGASSLTEITNLKANAESHIEATRHLAETAAEVDARIKAYESRLAEFDTKAAAHLQTIEGLLPGATSAGLASAFGMRRQHFKWPQRVWQGAFVASVLGLLGLAAWELGVAGRAEAELELARLGVSLLHRIPFALPLIWLAIYASRQAALSKHIEEDYAFKETASRSFEGYRRQLAEIEKDVAPDSPLGRFCTATLNVITTPPGLVYSKQRTDVSPVTALADSAKPIASAATQVVQAKANNK